MDVGQNQIVYFVVIVVGIPAIGSLAWYFFKRELRRSDESDANYKLEVHASFSKMETKNELLAKRIHDLEIEQEKRITRDELKEVRDEFKGDLQAMATTIINSIRTGNGNGAHV